MDEAHAPAQLARLWRLSSESRLGRPAKLDVDTVVNAAVALADTEGVEVVTLPKIAESLGVTKMSLYRYVGSKDELLGLMLDSAYGPVPEALAGTGPWRERLRGWALALARVHKRHPWIVRLSVTGPPQGPNGIGWFDAGLRSLRQTDLDWGSKVGIVMLVGQHVSSASQLAQRLAEGRSRTGLDQAAAEREYGRAMAALVDPERFPDAATLFSSDMLEDAGESTGEQDFVFGLDLILDGVAVAVNAEAR